MMYRFYKEILRLGAINPSTPACNVHKNNNRSTNRKVFLDRSKGIAIFLVVLGHVYCNIGLNGDDAKYHLEIYQFIALFHMPLFFFLSGIVTKTYFADIKVMAKDCFKRFRSIMIPFFVFGFLMMYSIDRSVLDFFLHPMKLGYWYLVVLFQFYMCNYIFAYFCKFKTHGGLIGELLFGLFMYIGLLIIYRLMADSVWHLLSFHKVAEHFPYFFLGVMVYRYDFIHRLFTNDVILTFSLLYVIVRIFFPELRFNRDDYVFAFSMIILIVGWMYKNESCTNILYEQFRVLGFASLDIYVIHGFIFSISCFSFVASILSVDSLYYSPINELLIGITFALPIVYISLLIGKTLHSSRIINRLVFNR